MSGDFTFVDYIEKIIYKNLRYKVILIYQFIKIQNYTI